MQLVQEPVWLFGAAPVLGLIAWIDARRQVIPNVLNLLLAAIGLGFAWTIGALLANTIAALAIAAVLLVLRAVHWRMRGRVGLGMGDVKMLAAGALWVGPAGISWLVLGASVSALLSMAAARLVRVPTHQLRLPFGPHIALALIVALAGRRFGLWSQ